MGEEKNGSSDWLPTIQLCNYLQCQIRRFVVNSDQHTVMNTAAETDPKSEGPEPYQDIVLYWNYYLDFLDDDSFKFFQKSFQSVDSCGELFLLFFIVFIIF